MQEKSTARQKVIASEIFKVQISCNRPTKELTLLFGLRPKCMVQDEFLKMYQMV
jgi:hypothetical protein